MSGSRTLVWNDLTHPDTQAVARFSIEVDQDSWKHTFAFHVLKPDERATWEDVFGKAFVSKVEDFVRRRETPDEEQLALLLEPIRQELSQSLGKPRAVRYFAQKDGWERTKWPLRYTLILPSGLLAILESLDGHGHRNRLVTAYFRQAVCKLSAANRWRKTLESQIVRLCEASAENFCFICDSKRHRDEEYAKFVWMTPETWGFDSEDRWDEGLVPGWGIDPRDGTGWSLSLKPRSGPSSPSGGSDS